LSALLDLAVTDESRDTLATLFWAESTSSKGRCEGERRSGAGAEIWLDVREFRSQLATCHTHGHPPDHVCPACLISLAEATALYHDDFLAGFTMPGSPGFDEWQFFQTEGLRQELGGVLERLAFGHGAQGELEPAIDYARRWVALEPLHEPAYRCLMWLYARSGQRAAALRQYSECERVLRQELALLPEEETTQLYEAIKQRRELPWPADRRALAPRPAARLQERYRLDAELSHGATGVVFRAYDTLLERDVAVKVLSEAGLDSESRAGLLREARTAARLNHPNVVSVYDVGEVDGAPFIVMELVEGESLQAERAAPPDASSWPRTIAIARQVCAALEHAHAHGIVHRDLNPANVLLARDPLAGTSGQVKLVDFGLARPMASRVTSGGIIVGTVFYLAPELALGQAYDGRADLYSLGVMLYELTTGRLPFVADDSMDVISQHLRAPLVPPRAKNPGIPPALDRLIVRLLSKNPEDRPSSAAQVLRLLNSPELLDGEALPTEELSVLERIERGRMVGRERELQEARALWTQALSGQGGMLLVSGEPGIGKSRLVRELVTQAWVSGGTALLGACYAEGGVPYAPFVQILQQTLKDSVWESLNLPESGLADLLALAPALRPRFLGVLANPPTLQRTGMPPDDPQAEQHRLFENLGIFFATLSEQAPLLLILEDAHWADSGTLFLLRHLARQIQHCRAMLVATYRDVELGVTRHLNEMLLDCQRERLATRLKLSRLDREQTRELLAVLFDQEITPEFLAGIYAETEGNPFFIEEVCKALVESGRLYFQDGRWQRPSMEELGVPQSVRAAIGSRLKALSTAAQETLCLAAILGREFEFDILAEASDQDEEVLIEALEDAERAQLIEKVSTAGGGTFALVHGLIANTLIENTRAPQRRQLHHRVAAAIEARHPGEGSRLESLAHHYSEAGEREKAANYLLQAGDRARALYAYQEAIGHYQLALQYLKEQAVRSAEPERDLGRAARTLMKLGLTHHNALEFKSARRAYEEGCALWQRAGEVEPTVPMPPAPHALRVGSDLSPTTLDPVESNSPVSYALVAQLFSGLVDLTQEMDIVPDVAQTWEVSEGGRHYIFHLRDDVRWSDGVPVTAGDFEYAWKRRLDPVTARPNSSLLYDIGGARAFHLGQVSDPGSVGVRALDPTTLVVELEEPAAYFLQLLEAAFPVPRHVVEVHGEAWTAMENLVTNGPFRLESWQPGQLLVMVRNPAYHGPFRGNIHRLEWSSPADPWGALECYEAGDLDVSFQGSSAEIDRVRQRHGEDYVSPPAATTHYLAFDASRRPFDDPRLRQAFALATDRDRLADVLMRGGVSPASGGLVPPGLPGHCPGIGLPHDPDRARKLLAEAGYPGGSGFPTVESLVTDPLLVPPSTCLQEQWREVLEVDIRWEHVEWARYLDRVEREPPNLSLFGWIADYPDPASFLSDCPFRRRSGWRNEVYDRLVAEAKGARDERERIELYRQAERTLVAEVPILPLFYQSWHLLVKPWVRRFPVSSICAWFFKDAILEPH
jgi:ABC-type oligopeptide transport system substrate-binding subunit